MHREDRDYHMQRARAEMDQAYQARCARAADAHMKLSSLHMQVLKDVDERCSGSNLG
ncbi:MAG TPA: hypothetical protein VF702_12645 [Allosphingosinicella sp.]|jgi:hypothetical protein